MLKHPQNTKPTTCLVSDIDMLEFADAKGMSTKVSPAIVSNSKLLLFTDTDGMVGAETFPFTMQSSPIPYKYIKSQLYIIQ